MLFSTVYSISKVSNNPTTTVCLLYGMSREKYEYFMVTPYISNIQYFLYPADVHNVKKRRVIKTF